METVLKEKSIVSVTDLYVVLNNFEKKHISLLEKCAKSSKADLKVELGLFVFQLKHTLKCLGDKVKSVNGTKALSLLKKRK